MINLSFCLRNYGIKRFAVFLGSSSCLFAGEQEEINKAKDPYGEDARKILGDAQDSLKAALPEAQDYLDNPGPVKSQESFFGLGVPQPSASSKSSCQSCRSQSFETLGQQPQPKNSKKTSTITPVATQDLIVFVSLGMPEASLKQLAHEAEQVGARLVIQGLVNNSFGQTSARIQAIGIAIDIDPPLFDLFEVTRVPTFIRCRTNADGAIKEGHDRITGNISLLAAHDKFKTLGELS
ncbi:MAG: type-F conjugative transfer system pilin assembly protein TrbC [Janthinobacterium lividum]